MKVKATKQPVTIEAIQFNGDNQKELIEFLGDENYVMNRHKFMIVTPEGNMTAQVSDWIIKGVEGEFYPCKNSVFMASYIIEGVNLDE